jgi:PKD repeat protein
VTVAAAPPVNASPTAAFDFTCVELTCTFTDRSTDADGTIAAWAWTFGGVGTANTQSPSFRFPSPGSYQVALTVTDDAGATSNTARSVEVTALIHNAFLATSTQSGGNANSPSNWKATVVTAVHTSDEQPVSGATIVAAWSGAWRKTVSCVTSSIGQCTFTTGALSMQQPSVTLTVTKVSMPLSTYDPAANHSQAGSGTGTVITVLKP